MTASPPTSAPLDEYASGLNLYASRHPGEVKLAKPFPVDSRDIAVGFIVRSPFFVELKGTLGARGGAELDGSS